MVPIRILLGQNREHPTTFPGMFSGELSRFPGYPGKSPNIPVFPDPPWGLCFELLSRWLLDLPAALNWIVLSTGGSVLTLCLYRPAFAFPAASCPFLLFLPRVCSFFLAPLAR